MHPDGKGMSKTLFIHKRHDHLCRKFCRSIKMVPELISEFNKSFDDQYTNTLYFYIIMGNSNAHKIYNI